MFNKPIGLLTALCILTFAIGSLFAAPVTVGETPVSVHKQVIDDYLAIQTALAADEIEAIDTHAKSIESVILALGPEFDSAAVGIADKDADALRTLMPALVSTSRAMAAATSLKEAREAFGDFSVAVIAYRDLLTGEKPLLAYCPMADRNWLQDGEKIANPYFGSSMLRCGSIVSR